MTRFSQLRWRLSSLTCADRGLLGSGTAPASKGLKYRHKAIALSTYHVGDCPRSKCDGIKISNVKLFVVFIFVWLAIIRNIRKFALIQNFPLYGIPNYPPSEITGICLRYDTVAVHPTLSNYCTTKSAHAFRIGNDEPWCSFITCRMIECRLQIAIGTSNLETTVKVLARFEL